MPRKAKELPRIMDLSAQIPKLRDDEIPHWRVWRWAFTHPNIPWKK